MELCAIVVRFHFFMYYINVKHVAASPGDQQPGAVPCGGPVLRSVSPAGGRHRGAGRGRLPPETVQHAPGRNLIVISLSCSPCKLSLIGCKMESLLSVGRLLFCLHMIMMLRVKLAHVLKRINFVPLNKVFVYIIILNIKHLSSNFALSLPCRSC